MKRIDTDIHPFAGYESLEPRLLFSDGGTSQVSAAETSRKSAPCSTPISVPSASAVIVATAAKQPATHSSSTEAADAGDESAAGSSEESDRPPVNSAPPSSTPLASQTDMDASSSSAFSSENEISSEDNSPAIHAPASTNRPSPSPALSGESQDICGVAGEVRSYADAEINNRNFHNMSTWRSLPCHETTDFRF